VWAYVTLAHTGCRGAVKGDCGWGSAPCARAPLSWASESWVQLLPNACVVLGSHVPSVPALVSARALACLCCPSTRVAPGLRSCTRFPSSWRCARRACPSTWTPSAARSHASTSSATMSCCPSWAPATPRACRSTCSNSLTTVQVGRGLQPGVERLMVNVGALPFVQPAAKNAWAVAAKLTLATGCAGAGMSEEVCRACHPAPPRHAVEFGAGRAEAFQHFLSPHATC
jgi:hypothetical protein